MILGKMILMNSFIAIMLGNFEESRLRGDKARAKAEIFIKKWREEKALKRKCI